MASMFCYTNGRHGFKSTEQNASRSEMTFKERAEKCTNPLSKHLFELMEKKKSNLCVAVDTTESAKLLELANQFGPHICVLKTHIDILSDFSPEVVTSLRELAEKHNFVIFEDRKFADIGNTVKLQYSKGTYGISKWAELVTAHGIAGEGVIAGLREGAHEEQDQNMSRGALLLVEMSSAGSLATGVYSTNALKMAEQNKDFVCGIITQTVSSTEIGLIHFTPGVNITSNVDSLGQQYNDPQTLSDRGTDVFIVGRGICNAADPLAQCVLYKELCWNAYVERTE